MRMVEAAPLTIQPINQGGNFIIKYVCSYCGDLKNEAQFMGHNLTNPGVRSQGGLRKNAKCNV